MAKKNKNVVIDDTELKPTVLGEVTGLKSNPFLLLIIFAILMSVIYLMPEINKLFKIDNAETKISPDIMPNDQIYDSKDDEDDELKDEKYMYEKGMTISNDLFKIDDISYENNNLTYHLEGIERVDLNKYNYFFEIYNENALVKRIMLKKEILYKDEPILVTVGLDTPKIDYFKLRNIAKSDYPPVALEKDVNNESVLKCTYAGTVNYHFINDKLYFIHHETVGYPVGDAYDGREGQTIGVNFVKYDLNLLTDFSLLPDLVYQKNESPSVIKFEMETRDYKCE